MKPQAPFGLKTWAWLALTATVVGGIYLLTLCPYVGPGDCGELIVTAVKQAVPHPPGYPLYSFLAHLFSLLPLSTVAWRIGLFSACCQWLCALVLFLLVRAWLGRDWIAASVSIAFSLAPLPWHVATQAEVFALNNLFAVLLLWAFYNYSLERTAKRAYVVCAVLGLACTHHLTILLFAFPFCVAFFWQDRRTLLRPRVLAIGSLIFACMLLPYLYLFYLGQHRVLVGWGNLTTWDGFWTHVLRREYGTFQLANSDKENAGYWSKLFYFCREMCIETFVVGLWLWLAGAIRLFLSPDPRARFGRLLFYALLFYTLVFQYFSNLDLSIPLYYYAQSRMWMLPLLLIFMIMGWALADVEQVLAWRHKTLVLVIAVALLVSASVIFDWRRQDVSQDDFFERLGHSMLDHVERDAVILMREDVYVNALRYLQVVEKVRPDVHVIPLDELWWPWAKDLVEHEVPGFRVPGQVLRRQLERPGQFNVRQLLEANIDRFPIYVAKLYGEEEQALHGAFIGFPYGFESRVKREGGEFTLSEVRNEAGPFLDLKMPDWGTHRWESWETFVFKNYYEVKIPLTQALIKYSKGRVDWFLYAVDILKAVITESPDYRPMALAQLGAIYGALVPVNPDYRQAAVAAWREYLATNPAESADTTRIRELVKQLSDK